MKPPYISPKSLKHTDKQNVQVVSEQSEFTRRSYTEWLLVHIYSCILTTLHYRLVLLNILSELNNKVRKS